MKTFVLLPFEHAGAQSDLDAHAETRLLLGSQSRNFVLKMHGGMIFFKEPSRAPIYGIFGAFDFALAHDPDALVQIWKKELSRDNFGALVTRRDYFPGLAVRGQILFLVQSQGHVWVKEHFDSQWFELPSHDVAFGVFDPKGAEHAVASVFKTAQLELLDRALDPVVRASDAPHFVGPDANDAEQFLRGLSCFTEPLPYADYSVVFKGHSAFAKGEIERDWMFRGPLRRLYELFCTRNTFVGVRWSEGREEDQRFPRKESKRAIKAGLDKWGRNWRGNWAPQRARLELRFAEEVSAHERLEAALLLREWMQDKFTEAEQKELLAQIGI